MTFEHANSVQGSISPDYETKSQVARRLGVSERTIEAMVHDRRIPFIRLTSRILRFPRAEVDAHIARHLRVNAVGEEREKSV